MQGEGSNGPLRAFRRKLRALAAVAEDAGATAAERDNAAALKKRLEDRLRATEARTPTGDWTEHAFRLGRWAKKLRQSGSSAPSQGSGEGAGDGDWTDNARRFGKAVRRGYKKWLQD